MNNKKLKLMMGGLPKLEGTGGDLTLKFRGHRKNKLGNYEWYGIEIEVSRWIVQHLLRQVATMHERDRVRLANETARIEHEINAVKQPEVQA